MQFKNFNLNIVKFLFSLHCTTMKQITPVIEEDNKICLTDASDQTKEKQMKINNW